MRVITLSFFSAATDNVFKVDRSILGGALWLHVFVYSVAVGPGNSRATVGAKIRLLLGAGLPDGSPFYWTRFFICVCRVRDFPAL